VLAESEEENGDVFNDDKLSSNKAARLSISS
jgi:hypothetical protein